MKVEFSLLISLKVYFLLDLKFSSVSSGTGGSEHMYSASQSKSPAGRATETSKYTLSWLLWYLYFLQIRANIPSTGTDGPASLATHPQHYQPVICYIILLKRLCASQVWLPPHNRDLIVCTFPSTSDLVKCINITRKRLL